MADEQLSLQDVRDQIDDVKIAMLTTMDVTGRLRARPLTVQDIDDEGHVVFVVDSGAEWVMSGARAANVSLTDDDVWVSISGTLTISESAELLDELWDEATAAWFENGKADAVVAHLAADVWEYWTAPNKLVQAFQIGKAVVTDDTPDAGGRGTIDV
ncbi:pyridoxamine 5'-phosphate oxidase family protein [Euzebya tangerina]|uniref:pyridoxamine 5'-phosphate oxidase family protein n=1 Tax=Euzebya tangerina TaxID=591198 RepID=UPI000E322C45|nr:pyridoxamine 5'-phosphate oxidase family protein [Euzebya tangerina]